MSSRPFVIDKLIAGNPDASASARANAILKDFDTNKFICLVQEQDIVLLNNLLNGIDNPLSDKFEVLTGELGKQIDELFIWLLSPNKKNEKEKQGFVDMKFNTTCNMPLPCYQLILEGVTVYIVFSKREPIEIGGGVFDLTGYLDDNLLNLIKEMHSYLSNKVVEKAKPLLNITNIGEHIDKIKKIIATDENTNIDNFFKNLQKRLEQTIWENSTVELETVDEPSNNAYNKKNEFDEKNEWDENRSTGGGSGGGGGGGADAVPGAVPAAGGGAVPSAVPAAGGGGAPFKVVIDNMFKLLLAIPEESDSEKVSLAYLLQQLSEQFKQSAKSLMEKDIKINLVGGGLFEPIYNALNPNKLKELTELLQKFSVFEQTMKKNGYSDPQKFLKRFAGIADWDNIISIESLLPPRLVKNSAMPSPFLKFTDEPFKLAEIIICDCFKFLQFVLDKDNQMKIKCMPDDFKVISGGKSYSVKCVKIKQGEIRYHTTKSGFPIPLVAMDLIYEMSITENTLNGKMYTFERKFSLCDNVLVDSSIWQTKDYSSYKHSPKIPYNVCSDLVNTVFLSDVPDELDNLINQLCIYCRKPDRLQCFIDYFEKNDGLQIPTFSPYKQSLSKLVQTHVSKHIVPEHAFDPNYKQFILRFYLWKCANILKSDSSVDPMYLAMKSTQRKLTQFPPNETEVVPDASKSDKEKWNKDTDSKESSDDIGIEDDLNYIEKIAAEAAAGGGAEAKEEESAAAAEEKEGAAEAKEERAAEAKEEESAAAAEAKEERAASMEGLQQDVNAILDIPQLYVIYYCILYLISVNRENKGDKDKIRFLILVFCMVQNELINTKSIEIPTIISLLPMNSGSTTLFTKFETSHSDNLIKKLQSDFEKYVEYVKLPDSRPVRFHVVVQPGVTGETKTNLILSEKFMKSHFRKPYIYKRSPKKSSGGGKIKNNISRKRQLRKNKTTKSLHYARTKSNR